MMTKQARFVERVRKRLRLSQHGLAKALGIHWRTILRWENDQQPLPHLARLALEYLRHRPPVKLSNDATPRERTAAMDEWIAKMLIELEKNS